MNLIKSTLIAVASVATLGGAAIAQDAAAPAPAPAANASLKIATINMEKIFNDYYQTQDAQKELNALEETIKAGNEERLEKIKAIEKELGDMQKQIEDTSLTEANKNKLVESFNLKRADGIAQEKERTEYVNRRLKTLEVNKNNKRNEIVAAINKVIQEKAAAASYDLVLDVSANSAAATKIIPVSSAKLDITDSIIAELNKTAPEGYVPPAPAPAPAPAPVPAPAAGN